jgi:hypothetical protein
MHWWEWARAQRALETWVRVLIGPRPYAVRYGPDQGSYVRFDTQEIVVDPLMTTAWGGLALLPVTWRGRTVHELPGLQWRIARAMARHEAGHVLFTAAHRVAGELHAWLVNALEDERMERLTGAHYPPARADFLALARLLAARMPLPDPATRPREDTLLNACLFHRWDTKRAPGTASRLRFRSEDDAHCWADIRPLVEEAWCAPDVGRVTEIAEEILRRLGLPTSGTLAGHLLIVPDAVRGSGERQPGDLPLTGVPTNALGSGAADGPEPCDTDGTLTVDEDEPPTVDTDPSAGSLWLRPYARLAAEVSGETRRLLQALRAPAPNIAPRRSATSGLFSSRAYGRTRGERPLLVRREPANDPSGLAIVLLIDRTTSMGPPPAIDRRTGEPDAGFFSAEHRITHARRAAMLFELTCTAAGVPLCIGYAGDRGYSVHLPHALGTRVFFHRPERPVVWLRSWETPRFAEGPKALIAGLYGDSYSERLSAALLAAHAMLAQRPEQTKLVLYIHDGVPTDEPADSVSATVGRLRRIGLHVVGVFVGDQEQLAQLEAIFGAEHTIPVAQLVDLPGRLGRLLLKYTGRR